MGKKKELIYELESQAGKIYEALDEMESLLRKHAPVNVYERARRYWIAHVDGALLNRDGWLGGSFISLQDTIDELEGEEEEMLYDDN